MDSPLSTPLTPLPANDAALIRRVDLPAFLPVAYQTLARWACEGKGPAFIKIGKLVAYRAGDVREWLDEQSRRNTIQPQ